ncbi:hypothetical protein V7S43_008976 [Phytophthora oleae]|uniref:RxLR effector protein n=1 Tax=Phytophthora oleae TaxID=2107226 RepID=A0ABD3FHD4_9STRA
MRLQLLLVLVFGLASCYSVAATELSTNLETDSGNAFANDVNVRRYLKGSKMTAIEAADEERGFPGVTTMKQLIQKIPFVGTLKTMVKENPALAKANVFVSKHPRVKAATLIVKGQVKPLAIIGAVALTGGYIMYLVKG